MFKDKPTQAAWKKMEWVLSHDNVKNIFLMEWGYTFDYDDILRGNQQYCIYYDAENNRVVSAQLSKRNYWEV